MSYKYIVFLETGYCGSQAYEFIEFDEEPNEETLSDICWRLAVDNAESYGIYPECERQGEEFLEDWFEEEGCYSDYIGGYAVEYIPEKHDIYSFDGVPQFTKY